MNKSNQQYNISQQQGQYSDEITKKLEDRKREKQNKKKKEQFAIIPQWKSINKLKQENTNLKEEIQTEIRHSAINDAAQGSKMEKLQEEGSLYAKKIEIETKKHRDLLQQIKETEQHMQEKKKQLSSNDGTEVPHLQKKVKNLEYRLEKTRQRHNESLAEIKNLKEEVNAARRERVIFDNVFKQLESDLKIKEEELKKYIFETLQVEHERSLAQDELQKIKSQSEKEIKHFKKEYENAFQNNEFDEANQIINNQQSNNILGLDDSSKIDYSQFDSKAFNKQIGFVDNNDQSQKLSPGKKASTFSVKRQSTQQQLQQAQEEIEQYELIFQKLLLDANAKDLDEFIELFKNQDQINKELYEKSNKLNDEHENLELEIKRMDKEISKYSQDQQEEIPNDSNREIEDLKKNLKDVEDKNLKLELENQEMHKELDHLIKQIPEIFNAIGCQVDPEDDKQKIENEQINSGNLLHFIGIIEKRANEIIDLYNYLKNKNIDENQQQITQEKSIETQKSQIKQQDQKMNMIDLLEGVEKLKESEKIMSSLEFRDASNKEILKFKNKSTSKIKKTQQSSIKQ